MPTSKRALEALGLPTILEAIAVRTRSAAAAEMARALRPMGDMHALKARQALIADLRHLITAGPALALSPYEDVRPSLALLGPADVVLEPQAILAFLPVLTNLEHISSHAEDDVETPALARVAKGVQSYPDLIATIARSIDTDGSILDSASPELAAIRQELRALERRITRRLESITHDPQHAGFLQDTFVTKRSGRWVLPVRMDSKGMVEGVVHDVSRTGETAFMEPLEIIGLSNELENLSAEARAEEIRILRALTRRIRGIAEELLPSIETLLYIDTLNAAALLSEALGAEEPEVNPGGTILLRGARHPILVLMRLNKPGAANTVVPLDLTMDEATGTIVITGPNAGGKTIAIKTAGLLMLMAQCGLPVTAHGTSSFPSGAALYVDIGDEQSLEESLSTFSAHMKNIAGLLGAASRGDLVLIDELGTGTEPMQGAALGSSILHRLHHKGALTLATTHLMDIVGFVHSTEGMTNASMLFDSKTQRPLYRLVPGEPGSSHALDVAASCGLPEDLIGEARGRLGSSHMELQEMIEELKAARAEHEAEAAALKKERATLKDEINKLKERLRNFESEKRAAMQKLMEEARVIVAEARASVAAVIQSAKAEKPRSAPRALDRIQSDLRSKLHDLAPEAASEHDKPAHGEPLEPAEIKPGQMIYVASISGIAEVIALEAKGKKLRVRTPDGKELSLQAQGLYAPGKTAAAKKPRVQLSATRSAEENPKAAASELKLIGLRVDEALELLEPFLDHAAGAGLATVRVIHGMGTGALRNAVREHLKTHSLVRSFEQAPQDQGGAGATIVYLK